MFVYVVYQFLWRLLNMTLPKVRNHRAYFQQEVRASNVCIPNIFE